MKFIFPQNYDIQHKFLGFIDYSTVIFNVIWSVFIFCFLNLFITSFKIKLFIFIILCFPVLLFSMIGFNHENILYVFIYLFKYIKSKKIYLYRNN